MSMVSSFLVEVGKRVSWHQILSKYREEEQVKELSSMVAKSPGFHTTNLSWTKMLVMGLQNKRANTLRRPISECLLTARCHTDVW